MRKTLIYILFILVSGCSVKRPIVNNSEISQPLGDVISRVCSNNLTNDGFYIEKANLSFNLNGKKQKYLFSVKFKKPQNYLISLRSITGIEGARILITNDTVLINDRIGRRVLYGGPEEIERIIGINSTIIGISFGDLFITENGLSKVSDNVTTKLIVNEEYRDMHIRSVINRELCKVISVSIFSEEVKKGIAKDSITINYAKFKKDEIKIPHSIEITDLKRKVLGKISIEKIIFPWNGDLEFIAGKGYKVEKIK